jgi:transcriptional regulator with XRE-family HTH domain
METLSRPSDDAALRALGRRLARHRLNRNLTQAALAAEAGVSTLTVQRIEQGRSLQAANLIRILRALGLLGNLDALVPEPAISPIQQARMRGRVRQRASSRSGKPEPPAEWSWGDAP